MSDKNSSINLFVIFGLEIIVTCTNKKNSVLKVLTPLINHFVEIYAIPVPINQAGSNISVNV